jgi:membrane protease YdiL (CAAX protease family)
MFVSITDPKATPGLLVTPTVNTTLVIRDVLAGQATPSAFLIAFVSSCLYAGLAISLAARLFTTEQLVNPAWEPLSVKGLRQASRRSERRLPAIDEALALFAVSLLLLLYVSPSWMKWGFLPLLAGNEILLIAGPALLFAWVGRYRWVETFAWRRPSASATAGAVLLGLGALPWVYALAALQARVWPQDPDTVHATLKLILPALRAHPVFTAIAAGALAGICEEILFRGPIQTALVRRLPVGIALTAGAVLFAAAHLDLQGMLFRTLFGVMLGWVVWRGGSIFPAMLMHAVADSTHFALLAWSLKGSAPSLENWSARMAVLAGPPALAGAAALLAVGVWLFVWGSPRCEGGKR